MAINNRMENKIALIHNYLFRHPSLFWLCTKEMVVISINRTFKNWRKSGDKSHKISLLYFKFTKGPNMWNALSHHLRTIVVLLKSLESPWWVPAKEWVAPFGQNFPIWWPKKKGGQPILQRISLIMMAQSHHISRRKKVKFATFRPKLLGCRQNIIAGFQNILYWAVSPTLG